MSTGHLASLSLAQSTRSRSGKGVEEGEEGVGEVMAACRLERNTRSAEREEGWSRAL